MKLELLIIAIVAILMMPFMAIDYLKERATETVFPEDFHEYWENQNPNGYDRLTFNHYNRMLNVGCGSDTDNGTDFIDLYPTNKKVKKCDANKDRFPYKTNTFAEVYSKSNFEHLTNHSNFLKESYRVLKPGGRIVIETDNAGFYGLITPIHYGYYEKVHWDHADDRHYAVFTPHHLKNWLEKFGFKKITWEYTNHTAKQDKKAWILRHLNIKLSQFIIIKGIKPRD